jgi:hypothetical protein
VDPEFPTAEESDSAVSFQRLTTDDDLIADVVMSLPPFSPSLDLFNSAFDSPISLFSFDDTELFSRNYNLYAYYEYFHKSHPFILPQKQLEARLVGTRSSIHTLALVMAHVGSFYTQSESRSHLEEQVNNEVSKLLDNGPIDGFAIQALLLMAWARSTCNDHEMSSKYLGSSLQNAEAIGMHTQEFAYGYGEGDTFLEESWRRTWWML